MPISKVLNIGCEGVSIFICNTMQHVRERAFKFLFGKKLDEMDFGLFEGYTWSNMTSGEECYQNFIIKILSKFFSMEREVSTGQAIEFGIPVAVL